MSEFEHRPLKIIAICIIAVVCLLSQNGHGQTSNTYAEKKWESPELSTYMYDTWGLDAADVDGDGKAEILAATQNNNTVSIFSGDTFALKENLTCANATGIGAYLFSYVDVAQVDGDPSMEVVCARSALMGGFTVTDYSTKSVEWDRSVVGLDALAVSDIDRDGKSDIIVGADQIVLYYPENRTVGPASSTIAGKINDIAVADIDGTGGVEIVVVTDEFTGMGRLLVLDGQTLAVKVNVTVSGAPQTVCVGDLNGTGESKIIVGEGGVSVSSLSYYGHIFIYKHDGTIEWQSQNLGKEVTNVAVDDVDADQKKEIVLSTDRMEVWDASNKTAIWSGPQLISVGDKDALAVAKLGTGQKKDIITRYTTYSQNNHVIVYGVNGISSTTGSGNSTNTSGNNNQTSTGGGSQEAGGSFIEKYWPFGLIIAVSVVIAVAAFIIVRRKR